MFAAEFGNMCPALFQKLEIFAPGEQAARAGNRQTAKEQQQGEGQPLRPFLPRQSDLVACVSHRAFRIIVKEAIQAVIVPARRLPAVLVF